MTITQTEKLASHVLGDEMAILQLLEAQNHSQLFIEKIQNRLHTMQKHACLYGCEKTKSGDLLVGEKKRYIELIKKI